MALKLIKDFKGVLFAPRKEEVKPGSGVLYPRVIELRHAGEENGTLLAAFEYYADREPVVIPIFKSTDGGKTWGEPNLVVAIPDGNKRPGMAVIENDSKLIQLAPTQMDPTLLQISYGIAVMETSDEE